MTGVTAEVAHEHGSIGRAQDSVLMTGFQFHHLGEFRIRGKLPLFEVPTADLPLPRDGKEALRVYREVQPPIVLTDIKMPGMDGIELLQQIKREKLLMRSRWVTRWI